MVRGKSSFYNIGPSFVPRCQFSLDEWMVYQILTKYSFSLFFARSLLLGLTILYFLPCISIRRERENNVTYLVNDTTRSIRLVPETFSARIYLESVDISQSIIPPDYCKVFQAETLNIKVAMIITEHNISGIHVYYMSSHNDLQDDCSSRESPSITTLLGRWTTL